MNIRTQVLVFGALCLPLLSSDAQLPLGGSRGSVASQPFGNAAKVFADFSAFSAAFEEQSKATSSIPTIAMSGTVARLDGRWRLDIRLGQAMTNVVPFAASGQDAIDSLTNLSATLIWRPDKKVVWRSYSYPGASMKGYFEQPLRDFDADPPIQNATVLELSKQTIDGHPSAVNKLTVTDSRGKAWEYTVWNATDLNGFPIRLQWAEHNTTNVLLFNNVKLDRPDAALFEPPASQKYNAVGLVLDALKAIRKERAAGATR
jgi:hypothetical protein